MSIAFINGVPIGSISSINGVAIQDIASINGVLLLQAPASPTNLTLTPL